jgi:Helicase conserved C-terminal domain
MLRAHQQKIIDDDPKKTGIWLGTGSGKTLIALCLARGKTLVICPKTQKEDCNWEREKEKNKLPIDLTTISKETFRRDAHLLPRFDTVIVDEAHTVLGATPNTRQRKKVIIPKTSQLFEALETFLDRTKPARFYLVTATPNRSPMTVWGAAKLLGFDWDFYHFRNTFYARLPMPGREVWSPKKTDEAKERLANAVKKLGYIGRLEDYFDVPEQTFKNEFLELTAKQKERIKELPLEYPEAIVLLGKKHQVENGVLSGDEYTNAEVFSNAKIDKIVDYSYEFPKMVIFSKYRLQILELQRELTNLGKKVFVMTGDTKDRGALIAEVNKCNDYVFIVSAQISSGWELPECPVMVFMSRTYSFVDYTQSLGRIQRMNALKRTST